MEALSLAEFIALAKNGQLPYQTGGEGEMRLVEHTRHMGTRDLGALTAEAYNQDVLPADMPWELGLAQIRAAVAGVV